MIPDQFDPDTLIPLCKDINRPAEANWFGQPWDGRRWTDSNMKDWLRQGYNVGVRTGGDSLLVCIDADVKHGIDGIAQVLEKQLPVTLTIGTPSQGRHYWLTHPRANEIRNAASHSWFGPDSAVDIRGEGGYAATCPSEFDNGAYTVIDDLPIATLPDEVFRALKPAQGESAHGGGLDDEFTAGGRNDSLFRYLCGIRHSHPELDFELLLKIARDTNTERVSPLLESSEVVSIASSAMRYGKQRESNMPTHRLGLSTHKARRFDITPLKPLCGPFIQGGVYIVAGPPGVAKSFWIQHMAHCLAGRTDFCSWEIPENKKVLIVDGEMPLRFLHPRWQTMPDVEGVDIIYEDQFIENGSMPVLSDPKWQEHFLMPMYTNYYGVMVFDTTGSLLNTANGMKSIDREYWAQVKKFNSRLRTLNITAIWVDHTTGYDTKKVAGSYAKLEGIESAVILEDLREDKDDFPDFNLIVLKNRVYVPGTVPFSSNWHWSEGMGKWFRERYKEPPKKGKK